MKNWLIRTKTNYILGPISRDKLLELIQSGSLTDEDELCSGNGFWFYYREKDLLNYKKFHFIIILFFSYKIKENNTFS